MKGNGTHDGVDGELLDRLIAEALEVPELSSGQLRCMERRVMERLDLEDARGPGLWMVLGTFASLGAASSVLWLAVQVGIPLGSLAAAFISGGAALFSAVPVILSGPLAVGLALFVAMLDLGLFTRLHREVLQ